MAGKQAKILTDTQQWRLLTYASTTLHLEHDQVIVLLSVKAGLRAGEIARLTWDMVLDPSGDIAPVMELRNSAAKAERSVDSDPP